MNYYGGKEMAESFRTVRKNTIQIAQELPEDKYDFRPAPEARSAGELLVHIALGYQFPLEIHAKKRLKTMVGFDFPALMQRISGESKTPRSKAQIIELLTTSGEEWAKWLEGLNDDFLAERVALPPGATPESKSRFEMLLGSKEHEMHHRAQLMLIERMVGIVPHLTRAMQARHAEMAKHAEQLAAAGRN